jgi:uncharacterized phage-like protein YoqJ
MVNMNNINQTVCCFTGHRPQKLSFGYDEENPTCILLKEHLRNEIETKISSGCTSFITGMAMGADIWCAEIVIACRQNFLVPILLTAVIPYPNQPSSFPINYIRRYAEILLKANSVVTIAEKYVPGCMHNRNKYMVDHADCVVAVSSGEPGGTQETIKMAQKKSLDIVMFHPDTLTRSHIPAQIQFDMEKQNQ